MKSVRFPLVFRRIRLRQDTQRVSRACLSTHLNSPTDKDADELLACMNHREGSVVTDPQVLEAYNTDWTNHYKGHSQLLLRPNSTKEVSSILQYCNNKKIGIVPQAGNTGLVGGSVPISTEVILSIKALNQIYSVKNGIVQCDAGCILQDLQDYASFQQFLVPVDLGAKGSCCIGGNLSTNAGGQYFYRYGSLHANVLGLEVVLPSGKVLNLMRTNLKDNTGYDLKHLFIGAEGTLGIITKVAIHCPPLPRARHTALVACDSYASVQETLNLAKSILGEVLAAFEYMDQAVLDIVATEKLIPISNDENANYPYCILVETHGSNTEHDLAKMEQFLEQAMEQDVVVDGVLSQDLTQVHEMWEIRESCNPIVASKGYVYKYDVSLPISEFDEFVKEIRHRLEGTESVVVNWGHVIDGNLHLNVCTPGVFDVDPQILNRLETFVFESVLKRGGSISAEHGLGQCKNQYLAMCKDATTIQVMRSVKQLFDPNGIMNPGKYLPVESELV